MGYTAAPSRTRKHPQMQALTSHHSSMSTRHLCQVHTMHVTSIYKCNAHNDPTGWLYHSPISQVSKLRCKEAKRLRALPRVMQPVAQGQDQNCSVWLKRKSSQRCPRLTPDTAISREKGRRRLKGHPGPFPASSGDGVFVKHPLWARHGLSNGNSSLVGRTGGSLPSGQSEVRTLRAWLRGQALPEGRRVATRIYGFHFKLHST